MTPVNTAKPDPIFSSPRLASIYDSFDSSGRDDLQPYVSMIKDIDAKHVIDLGCGTGSLALLLKDQGVKVMGVDPAEASIVVAKSKPGAHTVEWVVGDAGSLPVNTADAVVMTGNVVQAITDAKDWAMTLEKIKTSLKPGGCLLFETRNPDFRAWEGWNKKNSFQSIVVPGAGQVDGWVELTKVDLPLVSFRWTYFFHEDKTTLRSDSTLLFRDLAQVKQDLANHGFKVQDVREALDRPGKEFVVIARAR